MPVDENYRLHPPDDYSAESQDTRILSAEDDDDPCQSPLDRPRGSRSAAVNTVGGDLGSIPGIKHHRLAMTRDC